MFISVIVPIYNSEKSLPALFNSLLKQTYKAFEVVIVDDCSQEDVSSLVEPYPFKYIKLSMNHGPAYCRNIGADNSTGDILVFTDSDCLAEKNWLNNISNQFLSEEVDAVMGRLIIPPSSVLGDSISALGFPAGGSIGFDKIWKVSEKGYTDSLSSCNCAVKKHVFEKVGGFDETFPFPGGEDSMLAYNLRTASFKIKYDSDVIVYHEPRDSLGGFIRWLFKRGISSYMFSKKVSNKKDFLLLRYWSTKNILKEYHNDIKFPLIVSLLGISIIIQSCGALYGKLRQRY